MSGGRTTAEEEPRRPVDGDRPELHLGFSIAWSASEPERVGEVALLPSESEWLLGRGEALDGDPAERIRFHRQRPGLWQPTGPLTGPAISRRQAIVRAAEQSLRLERIGKSTVRVNGKLRDEAKLVPGDTLTLANQAVLYCVRRPASSSPLRSFPGSSMGPFGEADDFGLIGESPALWELRERAASVAKAPGHVLIRGETGTGKEHVARLLHRLSARSRAELVARNAATFPTTLVDVELFGNVSDYPNPGMAPRPGLVGRADGSTLFLDEIGELEASLQSHLLRVLDAGGEYQRLGSSKTERSDLRLVCATNRAEDALKHDLLGRLTLRLVTPSLNDRREDVPLIANGLLRRAARDYDDLRERFFDGELPRYDAELVEGVLRHEYTRHVRELESILWLAITHSSSDRLSLTPEVQAHLGVEGSAAADDIAVEDVRKALEHHGGNQSQAWRELGLKNRYALIRLMKKYNLPTKVTA